MTQGITLFIIPARQGSKGLPGKNTKMLGKKPLIAYSIEYAIRNANKKDIICISTDDLNVISIASDYQIRPPFIRPTELSTDTSSTFDVVKHALEFYENSGFIIDQIILLQPTSPLRTDDDLELMKKMFNNSNIDMVVSVKIAKENPYFTLFTEDQDGNLKQFIKNEIYHTRQECPPAFAYNGSIYLFKSKSFKEKGNFTFPQIRKYIMPEERSIDIDTSADWFLAEYYLHNFYENN